MEAIQVELRHTRQLAGGAEQERWLQQQEYFDGMAGDAVEESAGLSPYCCTAGVHQGPGAPSVWRWSQPAAYPKVS